MLFQKFSLSCLTLLLCATMAQASNGVVIESKTVAPGATDVTIGIHIENDLEIVAMVIPLEFRTIEGDAYLAHKLTVTVQGRLTVWEQGQKFKVISRLSNPWPRGRERNCTRGLEAGAWLRPDSAIDFRSPDALLYTCVGVEPAGIKPGTDSLPGSGIPSLVLTFDVTESTGAFIIDTTCISPANHLAFVSDRKPFDQREISEIFFKAGVIKITKP